ncbi:hypothetical protein NIES4103_18650 [Nostoc sp. NIES-4103]|nr:hypothetical protein NIES4103_18650 [Nostoc sp. NIES-4103]
MDTPTDFLFLSEQYATKFNPFCEGEYLIIQTYPHSQLLKVCLRTFSYKSAQKECDFENLLIPTNILSHLGTALHCL